MLWEDMEAGGLRQTDRQRADEMPGLGMAVHFFLPFESSESRPVWPDLRVMTAS